MQELFWGSFQVPLPAQKRVIDPEEQPKEAVRPAPVWGHPESNGQDAILQWKKLNYYFFS